MSSRDQRPSRLQSLALSLLLANFAMSGLARPSFAASSHRHRARPAHHRMHARPGARPGSGYRQGYGYGVPASPTPDCRYPDGTPFDPDIIGGPNHVGDGGPAANLGGFSPCGY